MTFLAAVTIIGLVPAHSLSPYYPIAVFALWLLFFPLAYLKGIRLFYTASLKAAFSEELLYRGILYGLLLHFLHNQLYAITISSLVFGLAHMRNLWWAGWRRSWKTTAYAGFRAGPVFAIIRWLSGDIYLGILIHFLHNLFIILPPPGFSHRVAPTPTDAELRAR